MTYLKMKSQLAINGLNKEIANRMGLGQQETKGYAKVVETIDGQYAIPKPSDSVINEKIIILRKVLQEVENENGETVTQEVDIKVKQTFDEEGNDTTIYNFATDYEKKVQSNLFDLFDYIEITEKEIKKVENKEGV